MVFFFSNQTMAYDILRFLEFRRVLFRSLARQSPGLVSRLVLFDPPYPGIGRRWREPGHARETWYQIFHTLPWAHELVGGSREATRLYLRHLPSNSSGRKDWVTQPQPDNRDDADSQPRAL